MSTRRVVWRLFRDNEGKRSSSSDCESLQFIQQVSVSLVRHPDPKCGPKRVEVSERRGSDGARVERTVPSTQDRLRVLTTSSSRDTILGTRPEVPILSKLTTHYRRTRVLLTLRAHTRVSGNPTQRNVSHLRRELAESSRPRSSCQGLTGRTTIRSQATLRDKGI